MIVKRNTGYPMSKENHSKIIMILLAIVFVITTIPVLYLAQFDYATGDDLGYGWSARQALLNGKGVIGVLQAAFENVINGWHTWQGTWSSIILFTLEPSIWTERAYIVTAWIAVGCIVFGTIYFVNKLLIQLGFGKEVIWSTVFIILILCIQYIPTPRGGIYWYTSVAHYVIPYGACLFTLGWSLQFVQTMRLKHYIGIIIAMTYLGGAGYPALVVTAAWIFIMIIAAGKRNPKAAKWLVLPLLLEAAGLGISAMAPGNKIRGGEEFGFSIGKVIGTMGTSVLQSIKGLGNEFVLSPLLAPSLMILGVTVFLNEDDRDVNDLTLVKTRRIAIISILGGIVFSSVVRMPEIYASVGVSGGVPDTYHFVDLTGICIIFICLVRWFKYLLSNRIESGKASKLIVRAFIGIAVIVSALEYKPIMKQSLDYQIYQFAVSGRLMDFDRQMKERLEILNSNEMDVIVPAMSDDQGPLMHMPLSEDPSDWENSITAKFYGKNSVVAIPREEFDQGSK